MKPLYGHQEGAELGHNPQKPGRPSHCYHTLCIAKLRLVLGIVVHAGNETAGIYSADMLDRFLKWLAGRLRPKLARGDGSHQEAMTTRRMLQSCVARIASHGRRKTVTIFTSGRDFASRMFGEISNVLERISSASQLKMEERWQLLICFAFRRYQLVHRLYPPLIGNQIMLPLAPESGSQRIKRLKLTESLASGKFNCFF